jgi:tRNA (guanine26-N2/guanine27-N2)-dimethyltransferase
MDINNVQSVREGKAQVNLPPSVFYNPVQEFNRDLTVAVICNFVRELSKSLPLESSCQHVNSTSSQVEACVNTPSEVNATVNSDDNSKQQQSMDINNSICECNVPDQNVLAFSSESSQPPVKGIRILEGLAASGLRSVRFALEVPGVREIVANDFDRTAVEFIRHNAEKNDVAKLITASCADAAMLMYSNRHRKNRFDVIDLDPYGSPAQFLDAAVQSVADGGIICVTCTDMAVLCGNAAETCRAKYGAVSLRAPFCHEMALRILLQSIASHAAQYQRYIEPLLSLSVDFYVRVFVRLRTGQSRVKDLATQLSNVHHCRQCGAFTLQPLMTKNRHVYVVGSGPPVGPQCDICTGRNVTAGPIWSAPIHNKNFVQQLFEAVSKDVSLFPSTRDRIMGILSVALEELDDSPLYYVGDELCGIVHCVSPGFLPLRCAEFIYNK